MRSTFGRTMLLLLPALLGCGPLTTAPRNVDGGFGPLDVGLRLRGFSYRDDQSLAALWVPDDQVADYEIQFCTDSSYSSCPTTVVIRCTDQETCAQASGPGGAVLVQLVHTGVREICYTRAKSDATGSLSRARAIMGDASTAWAKGTVCAHSAPADRPPH